MEHTKFVNAQQARAVHFYKNATHTCICWSYCI